MADTSISGSKTGIPNRARYHEVNALVGLGLSVTKACGRVGLARKLYYYYRERDPMRNLAPVAGGGDPEANLDQLEDTAA